MGCTPRRHRLSCAFFSPRVRGNVLFLICFLVYLFYLSFGTAERSLPMTCPFMTTSCPLQSLHSFPIQLFFFNQFYVPNPITIIDFITLLPTSHTKEITRKNHIKTRARWKKYTSDDRNPKEKVTKVPPICTENSKNRGSFRLSK